MGDDASSRTMVGVRVVSAVEFVARFWRKGKTEVKMRVQNDKRTVTDERVEIESVRRYAQVMVGPGR